MYRQPREGERGNVATIVALSLTVLVGFAAIGVDAGRLFVVRDRIHNAADSAVLAGVQHLPGDPAGAVSTARDFLQRNGFDLTWTDVRVDPDNPYKLKVGVRLPVEMTFARVLGLPRLDVAGTTAAERLHATALDGVVPLSVGRNSTFVYGESVTLKAGAGNNFSPGNFGALQLGKPGANQYKQHLLDGFQPWVEVGQRYSTEPGNMAGPTADALNDRINRDPYATFTTVDRNSPRLLKVPVVDAYPNGRGEVQVVGFAIFFLERAGGKGRYDEVTGRFLRFDVKGRGSADVPGFGAFITRLSQ